MQPGSVRCHCTVSRADAAADRRPHDSVATVGRLAADQPAGNRALSGDAACMGWSCRSSGRDSPGSNRRHRILRMVTGQSAPDEFRVTVAVGQEHGSWVLQHAAPSAGPASTKHSGSLASRLSCCQCQGAFAYSTVPAPGSRAQSRRDAVACVAGPGNFCTGGGGCHWPGLALFAVLLHKGVQDDRGRTTS